MNRIALGILASLCMLSSAFAITRTQTSPSVQSSGELSGTVLDSVTGQPIEGVQVTIMPGQHMPEAGVQSQLPKPAAQAPQVSKILQALVLNNTTLTPERTAYSIVTDSRGRFAFTGLIAAAYSLSLRADGYNFQTYGEKPNSLTWIPIDIRETKTDLGVVRMNPEPQVSGTIIDLAGRPVSTMAVYLLNAQPRITINGDKRFRAVSETITDEKGHYVFQKIAAGRYFVAAGSAASGRVSVASTAGGERVSERLPALQAQPYTFHPGVPDISLAGLIDVPAGSKVELREMALPKPLLRSIRGRVTDYATGNAPKTVRVTLTTLSPFERAGSTGTEPLSMKYDPASGVFEATNLIPGPYRIDAIVPSTQPSSPAPRAAVSPESAFELLDLRNADVENLMLAVPATSRVKGKVVVTDGRPFPVAERNLSIPFQLMLSPLTSLQPSPVVTSVSLVDGTFEVGSGLQGKYRFSLAPLKDNYYVSEARLDGVRAANGILDIPKNASVDLQFTLAPGGEVQGSVVDKKGQPVKQAQGVLLPDPLPETISFYQSITANAAGRFTSTSVPPGNYRFYFWEGVESGQFLDRELLRRTVGQATPLRVEKGASLTVSVPIIVP